jgi:hypothetical protein
MPKWEYRILVAQGDYRGIEVLSVDGDSNATVVKHRKGLLAAPQRIDLYSYLKGAGQDGWEAVGVSPIEGTGEMGRAIEFIMILKRPIP